MRADIPKQYLPLLGRPVILHTLERLCRFPPMRGVIVGISAEDSHWHALSFSRDNFLGSYIGGASRARTVLNGLLTLSRHADDDDWVMVHDAVRPCVRHGDLDKLVREAYVSNDGALLACPVADTLKRAERDPRVLQTVPRAGLWRAFTPQMFRFRTLRDALNVVIERGQDVTDDSEAVESVGGHPVLVEGHPDNIKITHPGDLALAELFLKQQERVS